MPFLSTPHGQVQVHQQAPPTKLTPYAAYNLHAEKCSPCRHPLEVVRRGEQLCDEGHLLAVEVARALYIAAGEKAARYGAETRHVSLLVNFAGVNGPVYELCLAIDQGLNRPAQEPAVHYVYPTTHEPRESRNNHNVHYGSPSSSSSSNHGYYNTSSSPRPRRESRDETPRRSGNIRVNIPIEYGREASYYEEFSHSNGGRVTTKYYHTEAPRPQLTRANTLTEVSKPARKSTVHFNPEVKYYT